jgi:hypothetical protein
VSGGVDLYGPLEGDQLAQMAAMVRRNVSLEQTLTDKQSVIDLLRQSFDAVQQSFTACNVEDLKRTGEFLGKPATVRRVYLRMLAHTHEHMGQAIAYARSNGIRVPWPDPREQLANMAANASSGQTTDRKD